MELRCPHCDRFIQFTINKTMSNKLYVFQWPSFLGGADTKLAHTLKLWSTFMDITVIPNSDEHLSQKKWTDYLDNLKIKYCSFKDLQPRLEGQAISFCNPEYVGGRQIAKEVRKRGLRTIWGNEMFFPFPGELDLVWQGYIDVITFPSKTNQDMMMQNYARTATIFSIFIVENYIDETLFPYKERQNEKFTIGRLSRPDPAKYPVSFPTFYERLGLTNPRYRVMAWSDELTNHYKWHTFGKEWELLKAESESQLDFLHSLDAFVYPLGHTFIESWGRSTIEAMLTGCVPVVPTGHNFKSMIDHGRTGFICQTFEDFKETCQRLEQDKAMRQDVGKRASRAARMICDPNKHTEIWKKVFNV